MKNFFKFLTIVILIVLFVLLIGTLAQDYLVETMLGDLLLYIESAPSLYTTVCSMVCGAITAVWFIMSLEDKKN